MLITAMKKQTSEYFFALKTQSVTLYFKKKTFHLTYVMFKFDNAVRTDHSQYQSVDLGDLSVHACLTIPGSCGPAGGALSVWIRIEDCSGEGGIISSYQYLHEGLLVRCFKNSMT